MNFYKEKLLQRYYEDSLKPSFVIPVFPVPSVLSAAAPSGHLWDQSSGLRQSPQ
jgi:hypothetical protein